MLFVIDTTTREVIFGGLTANPTAAWTARATRNLFLVHGDRLATDYRDHSNGHRTLQRRPPSPAPVNQDTATPPTAHLNRLPRCDRLVNEYKIAA